MPRTLSPIAEKAAQLRAELKAAGITASVRSKCYSLGQALHAELIAGSWAAFRAIAQAYEVVRCDEGTGEVLCGGNTHLHLGVDPRRRKNETASCLPACMDACSRFADSGPGALVDIAGTDCRLCRGDWFNSVTVIDCRAPSLAWANQHHVGRNDPIDVCKVVADILVRRS